MATRAPRGAAPRSTARALPAPTLPPVPQSTTPFEMPDAEETYTEQPIDDEVLSGRKILIVDDDVRNIFALTCVLEQYGIEVLYAENGREGIDTLDRNEDIDLVLMDVMMPELDGYATTEAVRRMPQFADLPIIALTAKAMKGDREKSIESGASDYVPKPVDADHLLDIMRAWLSRPRDLTEGMSVAEKANILLVDDRDENLVALEAILSSLDQNMIRARSGEEALRALLTNEFAVILLDIVMPGMDGFEIARAIKRRRKTREVPIIFLTAVDARPGLRLPRVRRRRRRLHLQALRPVGAPHQGLDLR